MKKLLLFVGLAFMLGACAQKTCPTYAKNMKQDVKVTAPLHKANI